MSVDCSDGESSSASLWPGLMYAFMMRTGEGGLLHVFARMVSHIILLSHLGSWSKSRSTMPAESMGVKDRERYMSRETNRHKDQKFLLEGMILSQASMKVEYQGWSQPLSFTVSVHPISRKKLHCKFLGGYGRSLFCTAS